MGQVSHKVYSAEKFHTVHKGNNSEKYFLNALDKYAPYFNHYERWAGVNLCLCHWDLHAQVQKLPFQKPLPPFFYPFLQT